MPELDHEIIEDLNQVCEGNIEPVAVEPAKESAGCCPISDVR